MSAPRLSHRRFGFLVAGVLLVASALGWLLTQRLARGPLVAATALVAVALVAPALLWPFNRFWTGVVARGIGWFNNRLILGLLFFGVVSPWALLMRAFGRDRLGLRTEPSRRSYFEPVTRQTTPDTLREIF
jgi:hypothetical protein